MNMDFVEGVEEGGQKLLAYWHTSKGNYCAQTWKWVKTSGVYASPMGGGAYESPIGRGERWEIEKPYLLTVDPQELVKLARQRGIYTRKP